MFVVTVLENMRSYFVQYMFLPVAVAYIRYPYKSNPTKPKRNNYMHMVAVGACGDCCGYPFIVRSSSVVLYSTQNNFVPRLA